MALLVAPCNDKILIFDMSYVTIDTNHVTVNDFDVTIDRKYVTKDNTDAATSM